MNCAENREWSRRGFLAALGGAAARAQDATFSTDVRVVNVLASVRNKDGKIVTTLGQDDFRVVDNERPQTIRYFSRETNLPLTLGLLVDTSGSQRRLLGAEREASYRFLQQVLRQDKDQAFVIHFDQEVELLQDLTGSREKLEAALGMLEVPQMVRQRGYGGMPGGPRGPRGPFPGGGPGPGQGRRPRAGTVLYDAVLLAADELMKKQKGRKALIVLSDGVDTGSKAPIGAGIAAAQRADTLVYSVLFADHGMMMMRPGGGFGGRRGGMRRVPMNLPDGKKVLRRISGETGGGFFEVTGKAPIEQIFGTIQEELRNQYSLGFVPEAGPAGFHKLGVTVKGKGLRVQATQGYFGVS